MRIASNRNRFFTLALLVGTATAAPDSQAAELPEELNGSYFIVNQHIKDALAEIASQLDIPVKIAPGITGRVKQSRSPRSAAAFLDRLGHDYGFDWYYDGNLLHVTASSDSASRILVLNGIKLDDLEKRLNQLDILDQRFTLKGDPSGESAIVSGPMPYIEMVEATLQAMYMEKNSGSDTQAPIERRLPSNAVRVFRAHNMETLRFE